MVATLAYQAGLESSDSSISYANEVTWGVLPAVAFQGIRYTGETLSSTKDRIRPTEITIVPEVASAVTVRENAGGTINFALSYGTYDEFLASALFADWQAAQTIAGAAADITITSGTNVLSSTTSTKFQNITAGSYIRTLGFTNAANNNIWRVSVKGSNQSLTLAGPGTTAIVTETPALTAAQVRASTITNGSLFKSLYLQQKLAAALFFQYPGTFVSGFTLTGGVGQFLSGSFNLIPKSETTATSDASTGAVTAAPSGRIHDPCGGFVGAFWNDAVLGAVVDSFSIKVEAQGASSSYGMGFSTAQGMIRGSLMASGSIKMFFKDFTLYTAAKLETQGRFTIITKDAAGSAYVISLPAAVLINPKVDATGPGTAMYATFDIEAGPQSGGGSIQVDRLAAV